MRTSRYPEFSFTKGEPLLAPDSAWLRPPCLPMDKAWRKAIRVKFWATNFKGALKNCVPANTKKEKIPEAVAHLKEMLKLRAVLLKFGGEETCLPLYEDDLDLLLNHGEIWLGQNIITRRGENCGCHRNAAGLWAKSNGKIQIATGYYLMDDSMWRAHSWGIKPGARGGRVVETTNKALLYFGVVRSPREAEIQAENYVP